jgi:HK97 family phage portal protein
MIFDHFLPTAFRPQSSDTMTSQPGAGIDPFNIETGAVVTRTDAGLTVTNDRAMKLAPWYACIRNISEDMSKMPMRVVRVSDNRDRTLVPNAPTAMVLNARVGQVIGGQTVRQVLTGWALGWGNGYAKIVRDNRGRIMALYPIHPSRVTMRRALSDTIITPQVDISPDDDVIYWVQPAIGDPRGKIEILDRDEVFHLRGFGGNGLLGYSALQFADQTVGLGLAAQKYGASFFGTGGRPSGVLEHPGKLDQTAVDNLRATWLAMHRGQSTIAVLREGMKFNPISIPPEDAQFLQTRLFTVQEVARIFRVPLGKIQEDSRSTFSNVEQKAQEYVDDCLMPWAERWQEEATLKLDMQPGEEPEMDLKYLLRGDHNARANYYRTLFNLGALSPNDIRAAENESQIDDEAADEYYIQTNMADLDAVAAGESAPGVTAPPPQPPAQPPDDQADGKGEKKKPNARGGLMPLRLMSRLFGRKG